MGKKEIIYLHSTRKTASSSIKRSLALRQFNVVRMFDITSDVKDIWLKHVKGMEKKKSFSYGKKHLKVLFQKKEENLEYKVVTVTREPISISISIFFHNLKHFVPYFNLNREGRKFCNELKRLFLRSADSYTNDTEEEPAIELMKFSFDYTSFFMEYEIKSIWGIDVLSKSMKEYNIYENDGTSLLLLRFKKIRDVIPRAFCEFLGIENFQLGRDNITRRKRGGPGELYKRFQSEIKFSSSFVEKVYDNKVMKHLYSTEEISYLKSRWSK